MNLNDAVKICDAVEIDHIFLPPEAWDLISLQQQSYIDEFSFYREDDDYIEAWYADELLAIWNGMSWVS
jgi:hypothetical protein